MSANRMPAAGPSGGLTNLQTRVVSAVVLIAIVMPITWYGGLPFRVLCAVIGAAMLYEWMHMSSAVARDHKLILGLMLGAVFVLLLAASPALHVFAALAAALVVAVVLGRVRGGGGEAAVGLGYAGLSAVSLALLRDDDRQGLLAILFLFAVVWATDICAYFVGRAVGGPKLAPAISPGKTWSGSIGGTLGGIAAGLLVAWYGGFAGFATALVAIVLSVVGQVGDLFESSIKRRHGVKDSSNLIPGHGGVMDRVDALVAAAFAFYVIGALTGGLDQPAHGLIPL
jgi:phosphatidate cytidylyltransferase